MRSSRPVALPILLVALVLARCNCPDEDLQGIPVATIEVVDVDGDAAWSEAEAQDQAFVVAFGAVDIDADTVRTLRIKNLGRAQLEFSPGALRALEAAEWPGNIRQLSHAIEAAAIRAAGEGARRVELHHVFPESPGDSVDDTAPLSFQEATRRFQRELLRKALTETGWNVAETARRMDLARSHVYNLIKAFGLERDAGPR